MRTFQLSAAMLLWMFLAGCASTERQEAESALAKEKLAEFAPRLEQLHEGMSRAEVEGTIQARKCGTINVSGFMWTHYYLSPEILIGLHYYTGAQTQEGGEWPTAVSGPQIHLERRRVKCKS